AAGVRVSGGLCAQAAELGAVEPWLLAARLGRPFVTWKYAATLDGRTAAVDGTSRWITSAPARTDVHRLRGTVDAIMVGSGTVLADDPQLTTRLADGTLAVRQPLRVVLDRRGRVPHHARVHDNAAETLVLDLPDPSAVLKVLHDRGVRHVLLEGGGTLAGAFARAGLIDRVVGYLAPVLLGSGPAALGDAGISTIGAALRLRLDETTRFGPDLRLVLRPVGAGVGEPSEVRPGHGDDEASDDPADSWSGGMAVPMREE
ncbi:MAG TPA: RibD family protein, partial [Mycobacteriales bacterium]